MSEQEDLNISFKESAIRKEQYKQLLEKGGRAIEEHETKSLAENISSLLELVRKSDELIKQGKVSDRVGQTAEVVLDAQVIKLSYDLMGTTVQKIESENFSDDLFASALTEYVTDEYNIMDWSLLDPMVASCAKTVRYGPSIFGMVDLKNDNAQSESTQKQRQPRKKAELGAEKKPTVLTGTASQDVGAGKVITYFTQILEIYRRNKAPIPYYQLIIDPNSMMRTFDNSFQLSFMYRDGWIQMSQDADGMPTVKPLVESARPPKPAENVSFTSKLDHRIIQEMIKKYNIRKPMLKEQ